VFSIRSNIAGLSEGAEENNQELSV